MDKLNTHNMSGVRNYRVRQIPFLFGICFKKKLLNISSNFFFIWKYNPSGIIRQIIKNNFIQMAASAGHAVAYTIGSIFKHIIDCVQLYFTNKASIVFGLSA